MVAEESLWCEGIETVMLVATNPQQRTLWEAILSPGHQDLPVELMRGECAVGRSDIPCAVIGTFLRVAGPSVDRHRDVSAHDVRRAMLRAGFETLCREVA